MLSVSVMARTARRGTLAFTMENLVGEVEKLALVSFGSKHNAIDESDFESLTLRLSAGNRPTNGHRSAYM
jgi:hypothetical protein